MCTHLIIIVSVLFSDSDLSILSLDSQSMVILTQVQITDLGKGKIL